MSYYVCIAAEDGHSQVGDSEKSGSTAGEEDGGVVVQELEGEYVFWVIVSWSWLGAYPVHVMALLVEREDSLAGTEGEEEGGGG